MIIIKASLAFKAFLQSIGLASYILVVSQFFQNASRLGNLGDDLASILFLLLFVASALISALLILGYPFWLFLQNRGKEALMVVVYSSLWLLLLFVAFLLLLISIHSFTPIGK